MKKALPFLLYPSLGLLLGWASVAMETLREKGQTAPEIPRSTGNDRKTAPPWSGEDLYRAALQRIELFSSSSPSPLKELLADWTDEEIRQALNETLKDPDTLIRNGGTAGLLLREYVERDFDAALEWFSGLPTIHQANLFATLSHAWPENRAMEGLAFIREHKELFASVSASPWSILVKSIAETAAGGPEAVVAFLRQMQVEGFSLDFGNPIAFPQNFDFQGLLGSADFQSLQLGEMKRSIFVAWRDRDRDAALDWVLQEGTPGDLRALTDYSPDQAPDTLSWLVTNLDRTTPEQRTPLIEQMTYRWMEDGNDAVRWIESASTSDLKTEIRVAATQGFFSGRAFRAIKVVETIPEVEDRLRFLESLTPTTVIRNRAQPLNAENEAVLRRKLEEWKTAPERLESILDRYKNPPTS